MSTRDAKAEETRRELLRVARGLFADRGYADVGTEEIVTRAGLTRGALYHHFRGKRELFQAVFEQIEQELVAEVDAAVAGIGDSLVLIETGIATFLDVCADPRRSRIALVDAPTVLGWATWREIDERHTLGLVTGAVGAALDAGVIAGGDVRTLSHLLMGALEQAALLVVASDDPPAARAAVERSLLALVRGLRTG